MTLPCASLEDLQAQWEALQKIHHGDAACVFCKEKIDASRSYATVSNIWSYCHLDCLSKKLKEDPDWGSKKDETPGP